MAKTAPFPHALSDLSDCADYHKECVQQLKRLMTVQTDAESRKFLNQQVQKHLKWRKVICSVAGLGS